MLLLTEQEIAKISESCQGADWAYQLVRKTESALLEKLKAQEPVAIVGDVYQLLWFGSSPIAKITRKHGIKVGSKLYANPLPPDDVVLVR